MHAAPGGPWDRDLNARQVDAATQKVLNAKYGLDKPYWRQFVGLRIVGDVNSRMANSFCGAVCGNLGPSYRVRWPHCDRIYFLIHRRVRTLCTVASGIPSGWDLLALTLATVIGIPVGIIAALETKQLGGLYEFVHRHDRDRPSKFCHGDLPDHYFCVRFALGQCNSQELGPNQSLDSACGGAWIWNDGLYCPSHPHVHAGGDCGRITYALPGPRACKKGSWCTAICCGMPSSRS